MLLKNVPVKLFERYNKAFIQVKAEQAGYISANVLFPDVA